MTCRRRSNIGAGGDETSKENADEPEAMAVTSEEEMRCAVGPITSVEFSQNGELLASGYKKGRISILRRNEYGDCLNTGSQYNPYLSFQSHQPQFDYLKSVEVEAKINQIKWLKKGHAADFLLSSNDKTIKLWKIFEHSKTASRASFIIRNGYSSSRLVNDLLMCPNSVAGTTVEAKIKRVFANGHVYHVNSICPNSDQETFLSADDLRINLWHQEITGECFNIVDKKPVKMEELTEVITKADFQSLSCNIFAYTTSRGAIRLCDMRDSALCDASAKVFDAKQICSPKNVFSDLLVGFTDVKFSHSGRYLLTRDFLTVKVWDLSMETKPVETYRVHDYLRGKLSDLYENDSIFDKFECSWSADDKFISTGSYNNLFRIFKRDAADESIIYEAGPNSSCTPVHPNTSMLLRSRIVEGPPGKKRKNEIGYLDCNKKMLHCSWHPNSAVVAFAAKNDVYVFNV